MRELSKFPHKSVKVLYYIVENGLYVKEVVIVGISGCFYQICFTDKRGSVRLRESKLYSTKEEAESYWSAHKQAHTQAQERKGFRSPYAFMMH